MAERKSCLRGEGAPSQQSVGVYKAQKHIDEQTSEKHRGTVIGPGIMLPPLQQPPQASLFLKTWGPVECGNLTLLSLPPNCLLRKRANLRRPKPPERVLSPLLLYVML